ncbi:MAG: TIGR04076 family protein [Spirochaetes bacterium]|nr:TIGR04076 family protein [Spirochaetota bacterium]
MENNEAFDLNINTSIIKNHDDYLKLWKKLGKIEVKCIEKNEECRHNIGDTFIFENPYSKPESLCHALMHVMNLYLWRVTLGFPSWNNDDRLVFRIHCPDPKGTVWEMRKIR